MSKVLIKSDKKILRHYRWHTGFLAWSIHRVTGILLTLYIFVHLYVLINLKDPVKFESIMGLMKNPVLRLSEVCLLALVISHALNGMRLTLLDIGVSTRLHKVLFWLAAAIGGIIFLIGSWFVMRGGH